MFALIILDGDFYLPQNLLDYLADCRAQGRDGGGGVEVEDTQEILVFKVGLRLKPAAGHERISDAHGGGVTKGNAYVEIIIIL